MPSAPSTPSSPSQTPTAEDTDREIIRLQSRLAELLAGREATVLQPVTFVALGAGAQHDRDRRDFVIFTFPVHHGKCVRIASEECTARQFARSLVETLGGWDAVRTAR